MKKASFIVLQLFCLIVVPFSAVGATFTVTNTNDSGAGSLRQAIIDANNLLENNVINFQDNLTGTITLTSGELVITGDLTINGTGTRNLIVQRSTLSGTPNFRIFRVVSTGIVNINNLTIFNGKLEQDYGVGGGIFNQTGSKLNLYRVFIGFNTAELGGGILNNGILNITESLISYNFAIQGGGLNANGDNSDVTITNSTISNNYANWVFRDTGFIIGVGAGIINFGVSLKLINVTVANNRASDSSGGVKFADLNGSSSVGNSIIAQNTAPQNPDVDASVSLGNNLIGIASNNSGFTNGVLGDIVGTNSNPINPLLGELQNNGGPSDTHALLPGSPAINAGNNSGAPSTDQRGLPRISGGTIDIGSYELQQVPTAASVTISGRVVSRNRGIAKVFVYLADQTGETRIALTNSFGYYRFEDVRAGETYIVNVRSKRHQFSPQIVSVNGEMSAVDFIAEP